MPLSARVFSNLSNFGSVLSSSANLLIIPENPSKPRLPIPLDKVESGLVFPQYAYKPQGA
jgi:hypothetical protein